MRLTGSLQVGALQHALAELIRRHEVLRTTFVVQEGEPTQVIAPASVLTTPIPIVDLRETPGSEQAVRVKCLITEEAQRAFNLAQGPLLRVKLIRLKEEHYVLVLNMHHIIADGWSVDIFEHELTTLYAAYTSGKSTPLPELTLQYADFAVWQQESLQGPLWEERLAYWKQQLANVPVLDLRSDRPRPAVQTFRGASYSFALSPGLSEGLKVLSRRAGATLFMTLLAAWQVLLCRYSGQEDIAVGTPIVNRSRPELESLIGSFANTLVVRIDLSGDPSFQDLLRRVRDVCLEAYAHQDVPFDKIVEALRPERDFSHTPLFQVMFIWQNGPMPTIQLPGLTVTPLDIEAGGARIDLTFIVLNTEQGLKAAFEYNTDLFDHATIERMAEHFCVLIGGIVADAELRLSELTLLSEVERQLLLERWGSGAATPIPPVCVHELIEAQAERTPEAVAVAFEAEHLTYRELNQRANQLANYLQTRGVRPEVRVALCVERSLEMVVGLLGILKAGGAYVPLDPQYPPERLAFMLADAEAPILLTQECLGDRFRESGAQVLVLDRDWKLIADGSVVNPQSDVSLDNLAYVIYTSGSTGKPKGVQVTHRGLVNFLCSMRKELGLVQQDVLVAVTTPSFDIAALELYLPLLVGARSVL
jgi:hypothetical protein